ncbi:probable 2' cyclic ADP-D-ribose synthase BdTIR [Cryptomeria japonica]|uniref:probable 2' cyclic ADP-D-ribose synthase BdTIR n=1 Tax=Cryptomeria japonica TaxID=3369 RepID=UPI0025ABF3C8|nr:probable 2' cyclic ADP-D-ribose synthase BdTIR [Cryptomeria japonica]
MENIFPSHSPSPLSDANPSLHYLVPHTAYKVFINHRGKDTKQSLASSIYHNLDNRGVKVFLDKMSLQPGQYIPQALIFAIRSASVHVVILSENYAESEWCLDELLLIRETGAPIVPVFWKIRPSDVRMENKNGVYAKAFRKHKKVGKFDSRTLEKWKAALRWVSLLEGFISEGEQGEMVEKIIACGSIH